MRFKISRVTIKMLTNERICRENILPLNIDGPVPMLEPGTVLTQIMHLLTDSLVDFHKAIHEGERGWI